MKKVLIALSVCILAAYLIFAYFYFQDRPKEKLCKQFVIRIKSPQQELFIDSKTIRDCLTKDGLNPVGKPIKSVNTDLIEQEIASNKLIKNAIVYITNDQNIVADIEEREPIVRVMTNNGENYYMDDEKTRMPLSPYFTADLPIITGFAREKFIHDQLFDLAVYLKNNAFWNAQIVQIDVLANNDVQLIPRVGNQRILLGDTQNFEQKLDNLLTFYKKELTNAGWNKYSVINLKYNKQIVCTKR